MGGACHPTLEHKYIHIYIYLYVPHLIIRESQDQEKIVEIFVVPPFGVIYFVFLDGKSYIFLTEKLTDLGFTRFTVIPRRIG